MYQDQTAPREQSDQGLIVSASMIKSSLECTIIYAADVKADDIFRPKNIGRMSIKSFIHIKNKIKSSVNTGTYYLKTGAPT